MAMLDVNDEELARRIVKLALFLNSTEEFNPNTEDPEDTSIYLVVHLLMMQYLIPTLNEDAANREALLLRPQSWKPLIQAVRKYQDTIAAGLLEQTEVEIQAIRASACKDIYNLLQTDEVKTGRMKPVDVIKAIAGPLQKARFNQYSNIFNPVYRRLIVVREERAEKSREPEGKEENQDHTVLG